MPISQFCQAVNYSNFAGIAKCITELAFFNDVVLISFLLMIFFSLIIVRYNFPLSIMLPLAFAACYALWLITASEVFLSMLILTVLLAGALMMVAIVNYINR